MVRLLLVMSILCTLLPSTIATDSSATRKPKVKVKIIDTSLTNSNSYSYSYNQATNPVTPASPIISTFPPPAPVPNRLQLAFQNYSLWFNTSISDELWEICLFANVSRRSSSGQKHLAGVFSRWDEEASVLYYRPLQSDASQFSVELKCWDSEQLTVKPDNLERNFMLKSPAACGIRLSIAQAAVIGPDKILKASTLLAEKVAEFESNIQEMRKDIEEYRKCVEFAAGRLKEIDSKFCIDLIGWKHVQEKEPASDSTRTSPSPILHIQTERIPPERHDEIELS